MSEEEQQQGCYRRSMRAAALRTRQKMVDICGTASRSNRLLQRSAQTQAQKRRRESDTETNQQIYKKAQLQSNTEKLSQGFNQIHDKFTDGKSEVQTTKQKKKQQTIESFFKNSEQNQWQKFDLTQLICQNPMKQIEFETLALQTEKKSKKYRQTEEFLKLFVDQYKQLFTNFDEQEFLQQQVFSEQFFGGYVLGTDEAGRGPLAGPVVAASCYVPLHVEIEGVQDSKKITSELKRQQICDEIMKHPEVQFAISVIEPSEIDKINILQASLKAMKIATEELVQKIRKSEFNEQICDTQDNSELEDRQNKLYEGDNKKILEKLNSESQLIENKNFQNQKLSQNFQDEILNIVEKDNSENLNENQISDSQQNQDVENDPQNKNVNSSLEKSQVQKLNSEDPTKNKDTDKQFFLLVDGTFAPKKISGVNDQNVKTFKKGDSKCYCIGAASIIAKVHRDRLMVDVYDKQYPMYGFKEHKGYPTQKHVKMLQKYGPCEIHRKCYGPVAKLLQAAQQQI